jgi:inositol transport system substrate-binding protein
LPLLWLSISEWLPGPASLPPRGRKENDAEVSEVWKETGKVHGSRAWAPPKGSTLLNFLSRFTTNILDRNLPGSNLFLVVVIENFGLSALLSRANPQKKKEMKVMKLVKLFLPAIAIMAMTMGGTPAQAADKVKIGVAMALFDDVWLTYVRDAMTKWGTTHPDVELTIVDAANDTAKQVGQVENFLAQGMDAVIILPVDTAATGPMTKAVVKAGKPLVYVNRKPSNLPKGVVYSGSKSIEAGIMNMDELGKAMGGKGNLVILMGELSNEAAIGRTDGIKQVVKEKFPNIKIVREQTGNWKRVEGKTIMENWLASGQEINGVASNNDEMALGALQAIKAAGKLGKIPVGGTDGSHDALESMDKGELNNTVFQDPVGQGNEAVNAAYLLVKKQPNPKVVDDNIWIPYQPVTKENYKTFMK